jgi:hypothetical protein
MKHGAGVLDVAANRHFVDHVPLLVDRDGRILAVAK